MCPVKVKESLLDHASVGRILSCGNMKYSQIILVITCKMHGFLAEPSCPVSASNAKQPVYRDYLKLALTNDLYPAEALSCTKAVGFYSSSLCLVGTLDDFSITLCPARGDTRLYFTFPLSAAIGWWMSGNTLRLEDGIKAWKGLQRQASIEVTNNVEEAQISKIKNAPYFHWTVMKREQLHVFHLPRRQVLLSVCAKSMMRTMLVEEGKAQLWNKVERMIVWFWGGEGRKNHPSTLEPWKHCPSWGRASERSCVLWPFSLLPAANS